MSHAGSQFSSSLPDADVVDDVEFDEVDDGQQNQETARLEAEARRQGWKPLEEFKGNPADWVDAATFLKRGEDFLPIVRRELKNTRERNERLTRELGSLKTQLAEQGEVLAEVRQMARTASETAYNRAIADMKRAQREAAAAGEMDRYDEIQEQLDEATSTRGAAAPASAPAADPATPRPKPQVQIAPEVQAFVDENPWMLKDQVLYQAMQAEHMRLLEEAPALDLAENLERAKEAVMDRFPAKFGKQPAPRQEPRQQRQVRPTRRTVEAPSIPGGNPGANDYRIDSIQDPTERAQVRKAFEKFARQMPGYTEEEHMKLYLDPRADVLAIEEDRKARAARRSANGQ